MGLRLIIEDYEGSTTVFPLGDGAVTIGREEGNTIRLTEKNISRKHLRLVPGDEGWVIEDLQSYNGVRVNGEVLDVGSTIHEGDLIQIGDYQLLIGDETSTRATMDLGPEIIAAANDKGSLLPGAAGSLAAAGAGAGAAAAAAPEAVTLDDSPAARAVVGPAAVPTDDDFDEVAGSGGAGKLVLVLLLLGGLGAGAWFMFGQGAGKTGGKAAADTAVASASAGEAAPEAPAADEGATSDQAAEAGEAAEAAEAAEAVADEAGEGEGAGEEPVQEPVEEVVDPVQEPVEEIIEDEPTPAVTPTKKKKKKKKKAAAPSKSADELLADARKAQLAKKYSTAYKLAKQSYSAKASPAAAKVMGVAACKMGDAGKAKSAYAKLSGSNKSALKSVCSSAGISL